MLWHGLLSLLAVSEDAPSFQTDFLYILLSLPVGTKAMASYLRGGCDDGMVRLVVYLTVCPKYQFTVIFPLEISSCHNCPW